MTQKNTDYCVSEPYLTLLKQTSSWHSVNGPVSWPEQLTPVYVQENSQSTFNNKLVYKTDWRQNSFGRMNGARTKTWTNLLKEADLLSYWWWYVLFTLWTALERHPQISAVQLKILVQVCKSVLKKKKRGRQFRKISNTEVNYWKGERLLLFSCAAGFLWSLYSVSFRDPPPPTLPYRRGCHKAPRTRCLIS